MSTPLLNCGWDTETYLIGAPDNIVPPLVCSSYDIAAPSATPSAGEAWVDSTGEPELLFNNLYDMWLKAHDEVLRIIIQNAPFDICAGLRYGLDVHEGLRPGIQAKGLEFYHLIWEVLEKSLDNEWNGREVLVHDTIMREKLLHLSTHGSIDVGPKGGRLQYGLDKLVWTHFRIDISEKKVDTDAQGRIWLDGKDITGTPEAAAAWRLRFSELDGVPVSQWPPEAAQYAIDDSTHARHVFDSQAVKAYMEQQKYPGSNYRTMRSEALQVYAGTCLNLMTATGFTVDQKQVQRVTDEIQGQLSKVEPTLQANGVLSIQKSGEKKGQYKLNKNVVQERTRLIWEMLGERPMLTEGGQKLHADTPTDQIPLNAIATDHEVMDLIAAYDPVLEQFSARQSLAKIRDAFLPNLCESRVYTQFDILKETGRTSSYGASEKSKKKPLFRAVNSQQMPRQPGIRECFLASDPSYVIDSVDFGALELCSVAQVTYSLFNRSIHRDKINQGFDLHTYLGSAIAALKFPELVDHQALSLDNMDNLYFAVNEKRKYRAPDHYIFGSDSEIDDRVQLAKKGKFFRNMAKPVGLGYPGGLSHKTLVSFAKATYGVIMNSGEAEELKELWFMIYPEMVDFFRWVRDARDNRNGGNAYGYVTQGFDRFRAGATYCAVANGKSMQSLSADGAKRAICWVGRACAGGLPAHEPFRILDKCLGQTFIHDELLIAMPPDPLMTERSWAISQLMCTSMSMHMPDVKITAEPALMRRWRKEAEPVIRTDVQDEAIAWQLMCQQYGEEMAYRMREEFTPLASERLFPYEDYNTCAVEC